MHSTILRITEEIVRRRPKTAAEFLVVKKETAGAFKISPPPTAEILAAYRALVRRGVLKQDEFFLQLFSRKPVRSDSGIAPITVLTKPYPCPGKCVYCPTEITMPKSYLSNEPAAQRALMNRFDPYKQMVDRLRSLEIIGHDTAKIELIVKGGTWSAYPWKYQRWFIKRCFDAANHYGARTKRRFSSLHASQRANEKAKHRIIGLTLETRPDWIKPRELARLRELGCTRLEIGLQNTDNRILELIKRGHTAEHCQRALRLARDAGFKTDLHMMPQLPGATPESDVAMIEELFRNPAYKPDMIKIYPCVVTPNSELHSWFTSGAFTPYGDKELFEALIEMQRAIPRYCRVSRLIRDIPGTSIVAGNTATNLREVLEREMIKRGVFCQCLRCREIARHPTLATATPQFFDDAFTTDGGEEHFLSMEDAGRRAVFAFCRLRLPTEQDAEVLRLIPEVRGVAFIRELHTYGVQVAPGEKDMQAAQHKGLGRKLMLEAEKIARKAGYRKLAVISGIGVREYYRKLGYVLRGSYMMKAL